MSCPHCQAEHEPSALVCPTCASPLTGAPPNPHVRLGVFHPLVAPAVVAMLERRGTAYEVRERDDDVEVRIDAMWRDDLRAELAVNWAHLLAGLDAALVQSLPATGDGAPGWLDAPRGGHVDRQGRLVVDAGEEEERTLDAGRTRGPGLVAGGAILVVAGWWVLDVGAVVVAGLGMVLLGLFTTR